MAASHGAGDGGPRTGGGASDGGASSTGTSGDRGSRTAGVSFAISCRSNCCSCLVGNFYGSLSALFIGAIPVERTKVSRTSSDEIASLINHGWSFMIFPEGGRSPDGWGQPFRAGAAYLSIKCNTPVVPIHLAGTGKILRKGKLWPTRSSTKIIFGNPIWPSENENSRSYSKRIEQAVAELADESNSDWWVAKKRKYSGETPSLQAPEMGSWRKAWKLESSSSRSKGSKEHWPTI